jgi:hypothetical protein
VRRGVFDILRRGFDNTIANWPLSLIRFIEAFVFIALAIAGVIVILAPILVSIGIHLTDLDTPEDLENAMALLLTKWAMLIWIFLGVSVLLLVFLLIHSFVVAGSARVAVDADRVAGPELTGPRSRYAVFSVERWLAGGRAGWWPVFWIYNIAWGLASLVLLIPMIPTFLIVLLFHEQEAVIVLAGCFGLLAAVMLMIVAGFVAGMWSNRAIVAWAAHHTGTMESMRIGWQALKGDLGRHLLVALAVVVVGMAGSMFFASFSMFAGFGEAVGRNNDMFMFMTLPMRLVGSLLNSAFSAILGSWYLASYAALATDAGGRPAGERR